MPLIPVPQRRFDELLGAFPNLSRRLVTKDMGVVASHVETWNDSHGILAVRVVQQIDGRFFAPQHLVDIELLESYRDQQLAIWRSQRSDGAIAEDTLAAIERERNPPHQALQVERDPPWRFVPPRRA